MVFTSKTIIPGKEPIGRNKDGSYIYDGVQAPIMSMMPSKGTYDTGKQMSVVPKVWTPPTPVPMVKSPVGFNIMPKVDPVIAAKVNAPIEDVKGILQVDKTDPRIQKLEQHFKTLKQKGGLQLNQKQTEYVQRYKKNLPQYANVPDALLFGRIIMKYPEAQEKYGNIGDKSLLKRIVGLPLDLAKTGSDAIMEAQDVFAERQKTLNKGGNLGITNLLAGASAGRALGTGVMGMAGDVLNVASPFINPETGVTSVTEGLGRDMGTMVEKVPEEYRQQISDLMVKYPKISATLGVGFDLSNLIPFIGVLGKAKNTSQVDDILKQVKTRPATKFRGEVSQDVFDAGMNRSLMSDTLGIPKNVVRIAPKLTPASEKALTNNIDRLTEVSLSKGTRNILKRAESKGFNPLEDVARYDDLRPEVIDGKLNTDKGISRLSDEIDKNADILSKAIVAEGVKVPVDSAYLKMIKNIRDDLGEGLDYEAAVKRTKTAFRALQRNADENGLIALEKLDAMKKKIYKDTNYLKDTDLADKSIARALKEAVEDGTKSADVKALNNELSKGYTTINYLESIQGRAVKGGRLGNAFARVGGQVAGSALGGWVGALAGGEVASRIQAGMIKNIFKNTAKQAEKSNLFKGLNKTPAQLPPKTGLKLLPEGKPVQKAMEAKAITAPTEGVFKTPSSSVLPKEKSVSNAPKLLPMPQKPQVESGISSVLSQLSKEKSKSAGKKVNNSIIEKLAKKQETPKTPKTDYLNTTEAKMTDAELKSLAKKYLETSKLPVGKGRVNSDNMADYKGYARIRDYFKSQGDDSLLESKLPKTPMKTEKTSETLLNEYDSIKKEIDSLRENAMKKIKNGEDTGDLIPRIKELQTKEESIYNEYKSKRNIEEGLDESNRKIESDKVIEDKKITEMKKSEETDLRGFTDNMSPMEKGKAISLLTNKRVMYKGKAMTLRDAFEKKLEDGWKLSDNGLIFRNPEYLSHTVDVGTPVNKTESAYIKYISKSDTPNTPHVDGKTVDDLIAKRQEGTKGTYAKELQQEELNFQNKIKDSLLKNNGDMNKVSKDFGGQMSADWGKAQKTMRDWFSDEYGFYGDTGKKKLSDFLESFKKKSSLPLSQKSEVKYSKPDLASEAKKYKSADDFVKAQGEPVYHGTDRVFDKFDLSKLPENEQGLYGRGIYVSPNKDFTAKYGKNNIEIIIDKKANLFDWDAKLPATNISQLKNTLKDVLNVDSDTINHIFSIPGKPINLYKRIQDILEISPKKASDIFSESGIHGITVSKNGKLHEISIFDDTKIKTKQQLLDIYNKANKK